MKDKLEQNLVNFEKALISLETNIIKIENKPKDDEDYDIYRDSTIQRFEYSMEIARKLMFNYFEAIGERVSGQQKILKKAFEFELIDDEIWLDMIDDRNITSHEYSELMAQELLEKIFVYAVKLRIFYNVIQLEIEDL